MIIYCQHCDHGFNLPVTEEEINRHQNREALIQDIWPHIPPPMRELLISQTCPICWEAQFGTRPGTIPLEKYFLLAISEEEKFLVIKARTSEELNLAIQEAIKSIFDEEKGFPYVDINQCLQGNCTVFEIDRSTSAEICQTWVYSAPDTNTYTVKVWKEESDYNAGEAYDAGTDFTIDDAMVATAKLLAKYYAVEVYNTVSGETYFHSQE